MSTAFDAILEYIDGLHIIDTHEHLPRSEDHRPRDTDVLREYLTHYFNRDLMSAGLGKADHARVADCGIPLIERWKIVEPYWEASRLTGYGQCLDIAAKGLYGIDGIRADTIEALNEAFLESLQPGHFRSVLKDKSRIRISILDNALDCDKDLFRSVYRLDMYVHPGAPAERIAAEERTGIRVRCFDDWLEMCEADLRYAVDHGVVALKSGLAYVRSLRYERVTRQQAEDQFNALLHDKAADEWAGGPIEGTRELQDYMMHFVLRLAGRHGLTFQFHTGLQEGNGNVITNSDPLLMTNLFLEYPDVDFDIFHIGYPYQQDLAAIVKNFPNVFIDMCWAHIISPVACVNALDEWLEAVPCNKISAFGGDFCFVDGVYGHQRMARNNVAKTLARKAEAGLIDVDGAKQLAERLFILNPMRIFKLEDRL